MAITSLVLLPGLDGTGLLFADFVAELQRIAPEIEPIVVRYPTDVPLGYSELDRIARELLPKDRSFVLLGESFSGPLAISIAASRPPGLAGLILVCTFAKYPRTLFRWLQSLTPVLPVKGRIVRLARKIAAHQPVSPEVERQLTEANGKVSSEVFRRRISELLKIDVSDKVAQIDAPLLDVRALKDGVVPNLAANPIRRCARSVSIVEMEGPHFILQAKPRETAEVIRDFVQRVAT